MAASKKKRSMIIIMLCKKNFRTVSKKNGVSGCSNSKGENHDNKAARVSVADRAAMQKEFEK